METVEKIQKPIFSIPNASVIGVIGAEGVDKSPFTLYRLSLCEIQAGSGTITQNETVVVKASVKSLRDVMNDKDIVWEEVYKEQTILNLDNFSVEIPNLAYVGNFNAENADQRVGGVSEAEQSRMHLTKLLQCGSKKVLSVDEPINALDAESLRELESIITSGLDGCTMVISHDDKFLDNIVTHILDYSDDGKVTFYEGNFSEYKAWKTASLLSEDDPYLFNIIF